MNGAELGSRRRWKVNEERVRRFAERMEGWSFDEVRALAVEANVATFRNEFSDMYDGAFPWVEDKRRRRRMDVEKPWLDALPNWPSWQLLRAPRP